MKTIITLSALALVSNLAIAESFTYEQQIGSPDVSNQSFDSNGQKASSGDVRVSLNDWYRGNPDVEHVPFNREGEVSKSMDDLITGYDVLSQSNPDLAS
mgnify:CR=1 FL=1